jgi:plastocyanin
LLLLAVAAGGAFASARPVQSQSVLERTPNLSAGWTGTEGTVYFNFLHRFWKVDALGQNKVVNSPTFFLAIPLPGRTLLGLDYSSNSVVDGNDFNEYEFFARWTPVSTAAGHPVDVSVTGAFNQAASSGDAEVAVSIPAGPVKVIAVGRFLSDVYDDGLDESKWALGGGATIRVSDNVALAGDVVALTDPDVGQDAAGGGVPDGELDVAWSAALQLAVPYTPHTFSLQITNARTASMQGSSFGDGQTRYGFEFTIPITLSRYFGGREASSQQGPSGEVAAEVTMNNQLRYEPAAVTISAGQAVRWVNTSALVHTVTADASQAMQADNVLSPPAPSPSTRVTLPRVRASPGRSPSRGSTGTSAFRTKEPPWLERSWCAERRSMTWFDDVRSRV